MTIDLRAKSYCSLGPLISASISDSYIQGAGLIFTTGSCIIAGLINPKAGDSVTFTYVKNDVEYQVPKVLRVLSSFANPFTRTTEVSLGCKLTFLSDLSSKTLLRPEDDPFNTEEDIEEAEEIVTVPIHAQTVANTCLAELGIEAEGLSLTNKFSIESFDFSNGYVNILSDLMLSENLCGYLNLDEKLIIFSLLQDGGTGPVLNRDKIIEIGSINSGELPGEKVLVSYNTLKLQVPEVDPEDPGATDKSNWEFQQSIGKKTTVTLSGKLPNDADWEEEYNYVPFQETRTYYDDWDRLIEQVTIEKSIIAAVAGGWLTDMVSLGGERDASNGGRETIKTTTKTVKYKTIYDNSDEPPEDYDQILEEQTIVEEVPVVIVSAAPTDASTEAVPFFGVQPDRLLVNNSIPQISEITTITYEQGIRSVFVGTGGTIDGFSTRAIAVLGNMPLSKVTTQTVKAFSYTSAGQQAIGKAIENGKKTADILYTYFTLVDDGTETNISAGREAILETRPGKNDRLLGPLADQEGDPNNGYSVNSSSESEFFYSTENAGDVQRMVEFSMPYAPDDRFIRSATGTFFSVESDASTKATNFGRIQNKLLYANRYGINIQTAPELIPENPYDPIAIEIDGFIAMCRCNGMAWTLDSNGVVVGVDALLWGGIGRISSEVTGSPWFAVAGTPGSLPIAPPAIDGQITSPGLIPPWNEILSIASKTKSKIIFTSIPYALELSTDINPITTRTDIAIESMILMRLEAYEIEVSAFVPQIITGAAMIIPQIEFILDALPALAGGGINILVNELSIQLQVFSPIVPRLSTDIILTLPVELDLFGLTPVVSIGGGIDVPVFDIVLAGENPRVVPGEPYWFFYYDQVFGWEAIYMPDGWVN